MTITIKGIAQPEKYKIKWTIKRFFADCQQIGDSYRTPLSSIPYAGIVIKWYLHVFPKGDDEESKDSVSIFLHYVYNGEKNIEVKVDYQISILNGQDDVFKALKTTDIFKRSIGWGWNNFIKQDVVKNPENGVLIDDTLTILGELKFHPVNKDFPDHFYGYDEMVANIANGFGDYEELLESGDFADVTFNVRGEQINLHKAVLSCRSEVFKAMFAHEMMENMQNSVNVTDIDYEVMKELFRFLYSGKVNNIDNIASQLLIAADKYQANELKALCEKTLYDKLTVDNAVDYLKLTEMCDTIHLKRLVIKFVAAHQKDVVKKPGFVDLDKNVMYEILLVTAEQD